MLDNNRTESNTSSCPTNMVNQTTTRPCALALTKAQKGTTGYSISNGSVHVRGYYPTKKGMFSVRRYKCNESHDKSSCCSSDTAVKHLTQFPTDSKSNTVASGGKKQSFLQRTEWARRPKAIQSHCNTQPSAV